MTMTIHGADIRALLAEDADTLRAALRDMHPADIAALLEDLEAPEVVRALQLLPERLQGVVFGYLTPDAQDEAAHELPRGELVRLIATMSHDERADLFNRLPEERRATILPALAQAEREDIRKLASYPEGTAGSLMTSDYATLSPGITAAQAIEKLRREAPNRETIYDSYVIDENRRLLGVVWLRDLILARPETRVDDLMHREVIFARVQDSREEAAQRIARYDLLALPIVNGGEALVGIVTQDDAMDVQQEEATDDFHKKGGLGPMPASVRDASIWLLYRARVVWLVVLVFGNIFSGAGIAAFEDTIEAHIALVFFLPLLIDSGGNAGAQASTLIVRALATGDVRMGDWTKMIGREVAIAGLLGLTMALAVSTIGIVRGGPEIAVVVALSMVLIVLVGSLIGATLPFVLTKLKFDPATASAPLITSIADTTGVLIYFALATMFLPIG